MATITETTQRNLIKKFHTLLSKHGISNDAKYAMIAGFGQESSKNLTVAQLASLCDAIEQKAAPAELSAEAKELDKLRKQLMASIYGWRRAMGADKTSEEMVKGIACRAAGVPEGYAINTRFNSIGKERLRSLYNAFVHKQKDLANVTELTQEMIDKLTQLN